MAHFDIHTVRKKASSYVREKVKSARLAFSDVSPVQLLAEEATNAEHWGPETSTMAKLSKAAFNFEEYERIVPVLRSRLDPNAKRHWKQLVKTLTVLEYMLTHGPGSLANDFRADASNFEDLCLYNLIDQDGIDRGVSVRNKADRVLELLSKSDVLKEERARAQRITRGIHGFGSSIKRMPAATENGGAHQRSSDVSADEHLDALGPMDAERKSLLSDDTMQEPHQNGDRTEWKPFEKCPTIPSYLGHDDVSSPSSDDSVSVLVEPTRRQGPECGAYKKSLSSPGHFRPLNLQGSRREVNKEDSLESHSREPEKETGDNVLSQTSSQEGVDKEATPFDDALEMELAETSLHENVVQRRHLSVRRLFDSQKPVAQENAKQFDSHENGAASTEPAGNTSNLPKLPPPPPSRFQRIKQRLHASNLPDS